MRCLRRNALRSALTTLGIIIGVAALIVISEIGRGSTTAIHQILTTMGCNNLLIQAAPVAFLHHTAWEMEDVDAVGRAAAAMLAAHPERHVWGLGRHGYGSNHFWYLRDPAGNFAEYSSDLDVIADTEAWQVAATAVPHPLAVWAEDFDRARLLLEHLCETLPPEAYLRRGTASGFGVTVRALVYIALGHTAHHLGVLRTRYLAG